MRLWRGPIAAPQIQQKNTLLPFSSLKKYKQDNVEGREFEKEGSSFDKLDKPVRCDSWRARIRSVGVTATT